jgi:adenosylcobinamide kinase/adenosylcobinamide-phosphate guanylyltransferase
MPGDKQLILVLGGARSGKSAYAERRATALAGSDGNVLYVATAEALDGEMSRRIARHRASRPASWRTREEPRDLAPAIQSAGDDIRVVLIDCITLWLSNVLSALPVQDDSTFDEGAAEEIVDAAVAALLAAYQAGKTHLLLVSNEVGLGVVPAYPLGRLYRDLLGRVNIRLAAAADEVVLMVAGIPLHVKGHNNKA